MVEIVRADGLEICLPPAAAELTTSRDAPHECSFARGRAVLDRLLGA